MINLHKGVTSIIGYMEKPIGLRELTIGTTLNTTLSIPYGKNTPPANCTRNM